MYEYLEGRVAARSAARLVLDVAGVGYDLLVPPGSAFPDRQPLRVWTHLVVREDAHTLYGFPERETRDLFRELLRVRGVGPALALGVLSSLRRDELVGAILDEDAARLQRVKGVGKKTAEQILLDLRDRASALAAGTREGAGPAGAAAERRDSIAVRNVEDAVSALASVGYSDKEARALVERASTEVDPEDLEQLVRTALRR